MTQDEWREIVMAWALWVCGGGPPVQYRNTGEDWSDWLQINSIRGSMFSEWRVKPEPLRVRTFRWADGRYSTIEWQKGPEPIPAGETTWSSPWMEIPE